MFSPGTLATLKKISGWGTGSPVHQRLSLDGAQTAAMASYREPKNAQ